MGAGAVGLRVVEGVTGLRGALLDGGAEEATGSAEVVCDTTEGTVIPGTSGRA
ncbi:hypothetical protein [Lentzea sp. NPDC059081]|uniref:hypothetical protein n=1 Tax=Lentzea sp. NPDC059081 TaxID=3346719 RepID=UPI0036A6DDFF